MATNTISDKIIMKINMTRSFYKIRLKKKTTFYNN